MALMLLGLGSLGASATFVTARKATTHSMYRSQATDLAVSETERIRTIPYKKVGIVVFSPGFVSTFRGRITAKSSGPSTETGGVHPNAEISRDGVTYLITRHITWQSMVVDNTTIPEGYKVINVIVAWTDSAGSHSLEHQSGLYQGIGG